MKNNVSKNDVVLVVDDDEDMLILLQIKLATEGYKPICAPNAEGVIDLIRKEKPAIVLLDIHMRGVDGGDICKQIKSDPSISATPVVLFSAKENIEQVSKESGADDFIVKPLNRVKFGVMFNRLITNKT